MIGLLANQSEVGYYDMSQKIIKIFMSLLTSLGVVMIPHITNLIAEKNFKKIEANIETTFKYMSYFAFPMAFGLSAISKGLAIWFLGETYIRVGILMNFSSFIIIAITWSNIVGMQLLMPMMKEKEFTISVVCGAIINVLINIILIPKLGSLGAILATIVAEFTVTIVQVFLVKKYINVIPYIIVTWKSFIASSFMLIIVVLITKDMPFIINTTMIQTLIGIIIYVLIMMLLKSEVQKEINNKIIRVIRAQLMKILK